MPDSRVNYGWLFTVCVRGDMYVYGGRQKTMRRHREIERLKCIWLIVKNMYIVVPYMCRAFVLEPLQLSKSMNAQISYLKWHAVCI